MLTEIILTITAVIFLIAGFAGCVIPILPGPLLSFAALILISIPGGFELFSPLLLIALGAAALTAQVLDNIFPAISSKKAGAGRAGIWGSIIGMIAGMFFPPFGVIIGAFAGAFLFELFFNRGNGNPLTAALGVLSGTMLGILIKLSVSGVTAVFFISGVRRLFG